MRGGTPAWFFDPRRRHGKSWLLPLAGDHLLIVRAPLPAFEESALRDAKTGEKPLPVDPGEVLPLLGRWHADVFCRRILLEMYEALYGEGFLSTFRRRPDGLELDGDRRLEQAFRVGDLVAYRLGGWASGGGTGAGSGGAPQRTGVESRAGSATAAGAAAKTGTAGAGSGPAPKALKNKTWVEIKLVDEADNPVPNQKYRVTLPDGSVREGTLGASGRAYLSDIDPGECKVTFPDLDGNEWNPA